MSLSRGIAAAVVIVGTAAVLFARAGLMLHPIGDIALIELYTRDALAARLLEGPYSHFPWHHPGPLYFYVLAPIYALGGRTPAALNAGAAILSIGSLATILWLLTRAHARWTAAICFAVVVLFALRVDGLLVSVWNPHVIVLPMATFLLAGSSLAAGDGALLPLVIGVGSFAVQTDVAVVPVVAVVGLIALIGCARRSRVSRRQLAAVVAVTAMAWFVPVFEQVTAASSGNATALIRFFTTPRPSQPSADTFGAWAVAMATPFRGIRRPILPPSGNNVAAATWFDLTAASILFVATIAVAVLAIRRGRRAFVWTAAIATIAAIAALMSIARIDGPITDHQVFWMSIIAVLELTVVIGFLLDRFADAKQPVAMTPAAATTMLLLLAVPSAATLNQLDRARRGSAPATEFLPSIGAFGGSIRQYVQRIGARRPLVRIDQQQWGIAAGILLQLQRLGVPFDVEESWASMFPKRYRESGAEDVELTIVATGTNRQIGERPGDLLIDMSTHVEVHGRRLH